MPDVTHKADKTRTRPAAASAPHRTAPHHTTPRRTAPHHTTPQLTCTAPHRTSHIAHHTSHIAHRTPHLPPAPLPLRAGAESRCRPPRGRPRRGQTRAPAPRRRRHRHQHRCRHLPPALAALPLRIWRRQRSRARRGGRAPPAHTHTCTAARERRLRRAVQRAERVGGGWRFCGLGDAKPPHPSIATAAPCRSAVSERRVWGPDNNASNTNGHTPPTVHLSTSLTPSPGHTHSRPPPWGRAWRPAPGGSSGSRPWAELLRTARRCHCHYC